MGLSCGRDVISIPEALYAHTTQLRHQEDWLPHRRALHCGDDQFPHPEVGAARPGAGADQPEDCQWRFDI